MLKAKLSPAVTPVSPPNNISPVRRTGPSSLHGAHAKAADA